MRVYLPFPMRSSALGLVAVLLCISPCFGRTRSAAASRESPQTVEAEVHALENGLLLPVTVAGEPSPARSLVEEMSHHHPRPQCRPNSRRQDMVVPVWGTLNPAGGPTATPDALFQAASIMKSLAATAALRLVQQGKLSLDGPVQTELKSWRLPENSLQRSIRLAFASFSPTPPAQHTRLPGLCHDCPGSDAPASIGRHEAGQYGGDPCHWRPRSSQQLFWWRVHHPPANDDRRYRPVISAYQAVPRPRPNRIRTHAG